MKFETVWGSVESDADNRHKGRGGWSKEHFATLWGTFTVTEKGVLCQLLPKKDERTGIWTVWGRCNDGGADRYRLGIRKASKCKHAPTFKGSKGGVKKHACGTCGKDTYEPDLCVSCQVGLKQGRDPAGPAKELEYENDPWFDNAVRAWERDF
jgi:hypothetical protein